MTDQAILERIVERIREVADPDKVVLFGGLARGTARPDSDLDILVVQPSGLPRYRRSAPIYAALADVPAEVEVIVYTPQEVQDWEAVPQALVSTALREGTVLYERQARPG